MSHFFISILSSQVFEQSLLLCSNTIDLGPHGPVVAQVLGAVASLGGAGEAAVVAGDRN